MSGSILRLIAGCVLTLAIATPVICQDLVGKVAGSDGQAVQGVKIIAVSRNGQITEAATTDASSQYTINGLTPGQYLITLDPAGTGVQGQTVASYLSQPGLTVNWSVAPGLSPLAYAHPGTQLASAPAGQTVMTKGNPPASNCVPQTSQKRCNQNSQGNNNCQGGNNNCQGGNGNGQN
jgi:hypothetical protein